MRDNIPLGPLSDRECCSYGEGHRFGEFSPIYTKPKRAVEHTLITVCNDAA
jgi:hypothetical protein